MGTERNGGKTNGPSLTVVLFTVNDDGVVVDRTVGSNLGRVVTTNDEFRFVLTETKVERELTGRDDTLLVELADESSAVRVVFIVDTETHQTIRVQTGILDRLFDQKESFGNGGKTSNANGNSNNSTVNTGTITISNGSGSSGQGATIGSSTVVVVLETVLDASRTGAGSQPQKVGTSIEIDGEGLFAVTEFDITSIHVLRVVD